MFSMRRAMPAIGEYNALDEHALSARWAERFAKDYKSLAEMVPEWSDEIEARQADKLLEAARAGDGDGVSSALRRLGTTCRSCHNENRAMVTLIYRTPDFDRATVELEDTLEEIAYHDHMERMGSLMNRIQIAQQDGRNAVAKEAGQAFIAAVKDLAGSCSSCHEDEAPRERILGARAQQALAKLEQGLERDDAKTSGAALGELGAYSCGRCHSIHKNTVELRRALLPRAE
jgi:cytochrome c556